jgi:hypothetical protein
MLRELLEKLYREAKNQEKLLKEVEQELIFAAITGSRGIRRTDYHKFTWEVVAILEHKRLKVTKHKDYVDVEF